jgi:hypothetical protein
MAAHGGKRSRRSTKVNGMSEDQTIQGRVEPPVDLSTLRMSEDLVRETREVVDHRRRVEALLASAEQGREQVNPEIFARVSADYRRQLDEIAGHYAPLRDRAGEELRRIKADGARLQVELDQVNDHLEELRFRCRVGEFDEKELRRREAEKLALVNQLQEQLKTVESTMTTAKGLLGDDLETLLRGDFGRRAPAPAAPAPPVAGTPMGKPAAPPVAVPSEATSPGGVRPTPPPPASEGTLLLGTPLPSTKPAAEPKKATRVEHAAAAPPPPVPAAAPAPPAEGTVLMSLPAEAPAAPAAPSDSSTQGLPQALLTRKKPDAGKSYVIDKDGLVLGRSNQCDVVVQGATVSRRHAIIRYQNGGYVLEDVSSGGGVLVNGQRQKQWSLKNGDEIGVGAAVFEFQGP